MSQKLRHQILTLKQISFARAERAILLRLADNAYNNGQVMLNRQNMEAGTGYSWAWIRQQLKSLEEKGFISRLPEKTVQNTGCTYQIHLEKLEEAHE